MFSILNIIIIGFAFSSKEPHSRMTGSLFERLNKQIINPNYILPPLDTENNIKGCDCRINSNYVSPTTNTFGENAYKYEKLKQILIIKNNLNNLSPEYINYIVNSFSMPVTGGSLEFESNTVLKTQLPPNTKNVLPMFVIEPLSVASGKNIKNGGLFKDFLLDI